MTTAIRAAIPDALHQSQLQIIKDAGAAAGLDPSQILVYIESHIPETIALFTNFSTAALVTYVIGMVRAVLGV